MAIIQIGSIIQIGVSSGGNIKHFVGLSTDQKPVTDIGGGSDFTEVDKSVKYIYDPENINPLTSTGWWVDEDPQLEINNDFAMQLAEIPTFQTAGGTATAITLIGITLTNGYSKTFIVNVNNSGSATTINAKPLYKPKTTTAPTLIAGKAYTVWYSVVGDCFFIKASAEGTAVAGDVLAPKTFSSEVDTGMVGTIASKTGATYNPSTAVQTIASGQYLSGPQTIAATTGTAVAADTLAPKTFNSTAGIGLTGTMPNNGAVVITPGKSNQAIPAGYHNGSGYVGGDADLVTENIRAGVNIFGVAGKTSVVDTADATINDGSWMLTPATAYKNGVKITGNMPNRGAIVLTPTTSNQVISNGYHSGSGYVVGDPDLVASNILNTANIFGVQGSAITGKRSVSGTVSNTQDIYFFQEVGASGMRSYYRVVVSGLSFQPSVIVVWYYGGTTEYYCSYRSVGGIYTKIATVGTISNSGNGLGNDMKADVLDAYVISSGFALPVKLGNVTYNWRAIE